MTGSISFQSLDEAHPKLVASPKTSLKHVVPPLTGAIIVGLIISPLIITATVLLSSFIYLYVGLIVGALAIICAVWFLRKHVYGATEYAVRLSNFAVSNNFTYHVGPAELPKFYGALGKSMTAKNATSVIGGRLGSSVFNYYNLLKFTSKGFYSIFEVELNESYPHILLDSRKNKKLAIDHSKVFGNEAVKPIEHQFEKHFSVYSAVDATTTLQVIEPSLMQAVLDNSLDLDIEIVNDRLYILLRFGYLHSGEMKQVFDIASAILKNLDAAPHST